MQTILDSYTYLQLEENRKIIQEDDFVSVSYTVHCEGEAVNSISNDTLKLGARYDNLQFEQLLCGAVVGQEFSVRQIRETQDGQQQEYEYRMTRWSNIRKNIRKKAGSLLHSIY